MSKILWVSITLLSFLTGGALSAFADQGHKPYVGSSALERMKRLAGNWEGTGDFGQGSQKIKASYKLTSAGSTIVETFHVGSPHEMISVYHDDKNKKLTMTHYCSVANQPKLALKGYENDKLTMDLLANSEIDVAKDEHIHAATIQFNGEDSMTHNWTSYKDGKQAQVVKIVFKRVN